MSANLKICAAKQVLSQKQEKSSQMILINLRWQQMRLLEQQTATLDSHEVNSANQPFLKLAE